MKRVAVLVFDDGFKSHLEMASILRSRNITGVFAITTGWIGRRGHLTWDDVMKLYEQGHEVCSHSHTHRNLTELEESDLNYELNLSKKLLRDALGEDIDCFVYPYGLYNAKVIRYTAKHYSYARSINTFKNIVYHPFTGDISPYTFGAIEFESIESLDELKLNFSKKNTITMFKILKGTPIIFFTHNGSTKELMLLIKILTMLGYSFSTLRELYDYYDYYFKFKKWQEY